MMAHGMYDDGNKGGTREAPKNQYGKSVSKGATTIGKTNNKAEAGSKTIPVTDTGSKKGGGSKAKVTW